MERLTGIAKTHGVAGLQVNASLFPWVWALVTVLIACGAIYLADPVSGAFGVLHSGKKGSELGIATEGGRLMQTSLALLTLEVYYRHLPLYMSDAGR